MRKVVAILGTCLAVSCAPKVQTNVLMPANHMEASQIKTVAVLPFTVEDRLIGKESVEFASQVESALASVIIDGKPYFKLIDRLTINRVIQEQKFNMSGLVSQDDVVRIGKLVGAKGVYTGVLHPIKKGEDSYTEKRVECKEKNRCIEKYVICIRRTLTFSFTPRLVDVETGRVVYSRTISAHQVSHGCQDTSPPASFEQMENDARQIALREFVRDVAPYYTTVTLELMDSKDNIQSKEDKEKFSSALDFAKKGRMDRACSMWEEIYERNKNSISLNYNLGICKELSGKPAEALSFYKKADQLTTKPNDLINKALKRASELLEKQEKLKKQMGAI